MNSAEKDQFERIKRFSQAVILRMWEVPEIRGEDIQAQAVRYGLIVETQEGKDRDPSVAPWTVLVPWLAEEEEKSIVPPTPPTNLLCSFLVNVKGIFKTKKYLLQKELGGDVAILHLSPPYSVDSMIRMVHPKSREFRRVMKEAEKIGIPYLTPTERNNK